MSRPTTPHPVSPVRPRPLPGPKPAPQPRPRLVDDVWFRIGVVAGVVGALLLVTHYFEPVVAWRAAA